MRLKYHGFYPLLAMVYRCFKIYLLLYRVYLECLQVQIRFGEIWWFWSLLSEELHRRVRCLATDGDFSTVRLSLSFDTRYSFALAFQCLWFEVSLPHERKLSRRWRTVDRWNSIGVDRQWCQNMGWAYFMTAEAQKQSQITRIPLDDQKPYLCYL